MSTLKETIRKDLQEKGAKREDITVALELFRYLRTLDELVFPENLATVRFVVRRHYFGCPCAHYPDKSTKTRYAIYLNGIADRIRKERNGGGLYIPRGAKNKFRLGVRRNLEELLVPWAAHEVRHRVQSDCSLKKFSPKSANLTEDELLKSIIEFNELVFIEDKKIYIRENRSKAYIKSNLNRKEFDARTIERLVSKMIYGENAYSLRAEITSVIKMSAP